MSNKATRYTKVFTDPVISTLIKANPEFGKLLNQADDVTDWRYRWQTYEDLKKQCDELLETLPAFQTPEHHIAIAQAIDTLLPDVADKRKRQRRFHHEGAWDGAYDGYEDYEDMSEIEGA